MPSSSSLLDDKIRDFLKKLPQEYYLDIGAGDGKFGKMIKKLNPKARVVAVEPDQGLPLKGYDKIYNIYASNLIDMEPDFRTDIVIMGDVIEHLKKSEALDVLDFLLYRCKYLIVKFPFCYIQYGNLLERHRSLWFFEDFDNLHLPVVLKENEKATCLVIIKGLLQIVEENNKNIKEIPNVKPLF